MAVDGSRAGHEPSVVDLNRWPNDETAVMRSDLQDLVRGAVAYGLDAFLEASRRQNYQNTTNLIGYVPPTMPGSPWNRNAGTGRGLRTPYFRSESDKYSEHHEILLFIAVKVHWRAAARSYRHTFDVYGTSLFRRLPALSCDDMNEIGRASCRERVY